LATEPAIRFEVEHVDVDGDRAVIRWRIIGAENYRGVNLMRVRDGKIVEALGYGKRP
jgi:ketosteroid isomerase-like protein